MRDICSDLCSSCLFSNTCEDAYFAQRRWWSGTDQCNASILEPTPPPAPSTQPALGAGMLCGEAGGGAGSPLRWSLHQLHCWMRAWDIHRVPPGDPDRNGDIATAGLPFWTSGFSLNPCKTWEREFGQGQGGSDTDGDQPGFHHSCFPRATVPDWEGTAWRLQGSSELVSVTDSARPGASSGPLASRFAVLQSGHLEAGAGVLAFSGSSLRRCAPRYPRHALCREAAHPPGKRASPRLGEEASALDGARFSLPNPPLLANGLPSHRAANSLLAWPGLLGALCHS